jgi:hypothetical protein
MTNYCYLVTIDSPALFRSIKGASKYRRELIHLLGEPSEVYSESIRYIMTKEQLALFIYLRCRAGGSNGIRDLDMKRAPADACTGYQVDLRGCILVGEDEPPQPTVVALAELITKVDDLLARLDAGQAMDYYGLPLNSDHMTKVLRAQRQDLRAKIFAAITVGA